jgi:hypothetical protein
VPDRPQRLVPEIPHDVDGLVMQLLEKDPARRPPDGLVLLRQLERLRGKYERKQGLETMTGHRVKDPIGDAPTEVHSGEASPMSADAGAYRPGPATITAGLMRHELRELNKGGPVARFFNHPLVLVAMLAACIGLIVYGINRKRLDPEELFAAAQPLMTSDKPADWRRAWNEYLLTLQERFPDNAHADEVKAFQQKMQDVGDLDKALERAKGEAPNSEAERFYRQGLALLQNGDATGARRLWEGVVTVFRGVTAEERWVALAERGLQRMETPEPVRRESVEQSLAAARRLRDAGKTEDARRIWSGIESLYRDDPAGRDVIEQVKRDRGQ